MNLEYKVKMGVLNSGALSNQEREQLEPFWEGNDYIYHRWENGYLYFYNGKYYQNGVELTQGELEVTNQVSVQRIILKCLIEGCQIKETNAKKIIDEIKSGAKYIEGKKIIKFNKNPEYFYQDGSQLT